MSKDKRSRYRIDKPSHRLMHDGKCYAVIKCGGWSPAIRIEATGETERSASALMDCDLLMGRWQNAVLYMFGGEILDSIPSQAVMEKIE